MRRVYADGPLAVLHCPCVVPQFAVSSAALGEDKQKGREPAPPCSPSSQPLTRSPWLPGGAEAGSPKSEAGQAECPCLYLLTLTDAWLPTWPGVPFRMAAEPSPPPLGATTLPILSHLTRPGPWQQLPPPPILQVAPVTEMRRHWQGSARWLSHRSARRPRSSLLSSAHFLEEKGKKTYTLGSGGSIPVSLGFPVRGWGFRAQDITLKTTGQGGGNCRGPDCAIT